MTGTISMEIIGIAFAVCAYLVSKGKLMTKKIYDPDTADAEEGAKMKIFFRAFAKGIYVISLTFILIGLCMYFGIVWAEFVLAVAGVIIANVFFFMSIRHLADI